MVTYSKYGRQASSKEIGSMRIAKLDSERTNNKSSIGKNSFGFSITDFNKGVAVYKNMYLGICSVENISKYISWLKDNEINFRYEDLESGMAFAKRYVTINNTIDGLSYRGSFEENNFFNEWNMVVKENRKNGR